ncbi:hypothetical protein CP967_25060 [Streptomyces nitrosporeus]|uniref:Uncharacterized protein n=1 Tax=Streptomyces nitrosporeus TaxID=28894 RepID=A0A5J6FIR9_9ACTN|nr:hypothetical protein [Streptomyces nitrosporeus]QEU74820.1 hypothetical protein CP967_25060 [Streptomyces nitrosporeus]
MCGEGRRGCAGRGGGEAIVPTAERPLLRGRDLCFNGGMAGSGNIASGRSDLEPFWPSRQHHDFDRVCCRAWNAQAL